MTSSTKGIVLDTSILIELLRSNRAIQIAVDRMLDAGYTIVTSTVCVAEVYGGLRRGEESVTDLLIGSLDCFPLSHEIAKRAGEIKVSRSRVGRTHGIVDMMVAATALELGYSVATDNKMDFEIPGLELTVLS